METPSEWAKRYHQPTGEPAGTPEPQTETCEKPAAVAEFPSEPFPCPTCGQLLAPSCRVCVSCKHAIDFAEVVRLHQLAVPAAITSGAERRPSVVRYPWRLFFAVLGCGLLLGLTLMSLLGEQKGEVAVRSLPVLAGIWVFFDALRRRVPRPLRWGLGTMLVLAFVLPWYLARRNKPESQVPFVEGEVGPVTRFLLFALLIFFLATLIFYIVEGPPPASSTAPPSQEHRGGGRITSLLPWKGAGPRRWLR